MKIKSTSQKNSINFKACSVAPQQVLIIRKYIPDVVEGSLKALKDMSAILGKNFEKDYIYNYPGVGYVNSLSRDHFFKTDEKLPKVLLNDSEINEIEKISEKFKYNKEKLFSKFRQILNPLKPMSEELTMNAYFFDEHIKSKQINFHNTISEIETEIINSKDNENSKIINLQKIMKEKNELKIIDEAEVKSYTEQIACDFKKYI